MPFPTETWESRQRDYRKQDDRDEARRQAQFPHLYQTEEKPDLEASTIRSFYRRKYGRRF